MPRWPGPRSAAPTGFKYGLSSKRGMSKEGAMSEPTIACPHCRSEIKLTESLAAPLVASLREQYELRLARQQSEMAAREKDVAAKQEAVDRAAESLKERLAEAM